MARQISDYFQGGQDMESKLLPKIERLQDWVNDLQAGMYINCVYCGHRYGPDDEVPAAMADVLKEHIAKCPDHPMAKLIKALQDLVALKDYKDWHGKTTDYLEKQPLVWRQARDVLGSIPDSEL